MYPSAINRRLSYSGKLALNMYFVHVVEINECTMAQLQYDEQYSVDKGRGPIRRALSTPRRYLSHSAPEAHAHFTERTHTP